MCFWPCPGLSEGRQPQRRVPPLQPACQGQALAELQSVSLLCSLPEGLQGARRQRQDPALCTARADRGAAACSCANPDTLAGIQAALLCVETWGPGGALLKPLLRGCWDLLLFALCPGTAPTLGAVSPSVSISQSCEVGEVEESQGGAGKPLQ